MRLTLSNKSKENLPLNKGAAIPAVGLGTWRAGPGEVGKAKEIGEGIRAFGVPREEIFIRTKLANIWHKRVEEGLTISLNNLGAEMQELPSSGRVRAIGVSSFNIRYLERLFSAPTTTIVPALGIHPSGYAPLGATNSPIYNKMVQDIAAKYGKSVPQVLLAWAIQPGWSVLPKSTNESRIAANLNGLKGWELEEEDLKKLSSIPDRFKAFTDGWLQGVVRWG
ncbi:NADP-dependent oxidoreductase domain-containing protein [Kalaharituber pfeilii]|nr:NADP-dependent oxidoreductase domain-containing protein [Kalaharituber pfeilii]